jgi:hypothetical protein
MCSDYPTLATCLRQQVPGVVAGELSPVFLSSFSLVLVVVPPGEAMSVSNVCVFKAGKLRNEVNRVLTKGQHPALQ